MFEVRLIFPDDIWKAVVFGVFLLWLIYSIATTSYTIGRVDAGEEWNFPIWACWLELSVVALWVGIFVLSLRGWTRLAIALWIIVASLWGIMWLGTIG
jgi:hypothetical protein